VDYLATFYVCPLHTNDFLCERWAFSACLSKKIRKDFSLGTLFVWGPSPAPPFKALSNKEPLLRLALWKVWLLEEPSLPLCKGCMLAVMGHAENMHFLEKNYERDPPWKRSCLMVEKEVLDQCTTSGTGAVWHFGKSLAIFGMQVLRSSLLRLFFGFSGFSNERGKQGDASASR
jgi:hypothetical protein